MGQPGAGKARHFYITAMHIRNELSMSEYVLLILNSRGQLRELYCPFRVIVIQPVGIYKAGTTVWVERVVKSSGSKQSILYQIYGTLYLFECFAIQIHF